MTDSVRELLAEVSPQILESIKALEAEKREDSVFFRDLIRPLLLDLCK